MRLEFRREDLDNTIYADAKYFNDTINTMQRKLEKFRMEFWTRMVATLEGISGEEFENWSLNINDDRVLFTGEGDPQKHEDVEALIDKMANALVDILPTEEQENAITEYFEAVDILPTEEQENALTEYFETVDCTACNRDGHCAIQEMAKIRGFDYQKIQNREGVTK